MINESDIKPSKKIEYPYLPEGRKILYVPADNPFMQAAKEYAREHSLDKAMPNAAVIVRNGEIIAAGANGSDYHDKHGCKRAKLGLPSGQGYDLCEGCSPKNHGEATAIRNAQENGIDVEGADLYLWGHWWCCEDCWNAMIDAGIRNVYLLEDSWELFNKDSDKNIIGRQFD